MSNSEPTQQNTPPHPSPQPAPSPLLPCGCLRSSILPTSTSPSISPLKSPPAYPSTTASFSSTTPRRITPSPSPSSTSSATSTPTSLHRSSTSYSSLDLAFSPTDTAFSPVPTGEHPSDHTYHWQYYIPHISTSTEDHYTDCSWIAFDLVEPPAASDNPSGTPTRTTQYAETGVVDGEEDLQMDTAAPLRSPMPRSPEDVELPFIGEEEFEYYTSPTEGGGMRYPFIGYVRARQADVGSAADGDRTSRRRDGIGNGNKSDGELRDDRELGEEGGRKGDCLRRQSRGLAGLLGSLRLSRRRGRGRGSRRYTS